VRSVHHAHLRLTTLSGQVAMNRLSQINMVHFLGTEALQAHLGYGLMQLRRGLGMTLPGLSPLRRPVYKPRPTHPSSVADPRSRRQWHKQPPPTAPRMGTPTNSSGPWRLDRSASSMATSAPALSMPCARP